MQAVVWHFLIDLVTTSKYEARLVPRGVYFTGVTQGGETFDQVTGHLKRYLRIDGGPTPAASVPGEGEGRSYFLKGLLQDVIFREAGLAGRNLRWERRYRRLHRSAEHTSELQSLMRISYAVFCLKKKTYNNRNTIT